MIMKFGYHLYHLGYFELQIKKWQVIHSKNIHFIYNNSVAFRIKNLSKPLRIQYFRIFLLYYSQTDSLMVAIWLPLFQWSHPDIRISNGRKACLFLCVSFLTATKPSQEPLKRFHFAFQCLKLDRIPCLKLNSDRRTRITMLARGKGRNLNKIWVSPASRKKDVYLHLQKMA